MLTRRMNIYKEMIITFIYAKKKNEYTWRNDGSIRNFSLNAYNWYFTIIRKYNQRIKSSEYVKKIWWLKNVWWTLIDINCYRVFRHTFLYFISYRLYIMYIQLSIMVSIATVFLGTKQTLLMAKINHMIYFNH